MPKIFVSYSWTNPAHENWVLNLSTALQEDGVEVVLDKWDLREGHDAIKFMEQMVTDPKIDKVILVVDRQYSEKSDSRTGGVGTEAQIISPELYGSKAQDKFVAVVRERDSEGRPFLPTYYKSRIYIDFSDEDLFQESFERLVRWAFDKPIHQKPALGKVPSFVTETPRVSIAVNSKAKRAVEALRNGHANSLALTQEYLHELAENFEEFRIAGANIANFDELVVNSMEDFRIYENQFFDLVRTLARYQKDSEATRTLHRFFESLIRYFYRPSTASSWSESNADNYKIVVHRMFLVATSILLKQERFDVLSGLTSASYYVGNIDEFNNISSLKYDVFSQYPRSLETRNQRLKLKRISLHADLLMEFAKVSNIPDNEIFQADFFLYLVSARSADRYHVWYPVSLPFMDRYRKPFEIFARSSSRQYFLQVLPALGFDDLAAFKAFLNEFKNGDRKPPQSDGWTSLDPYRMANAEFLGTEN